jgi:uncharacterized protein (DUF58 family)
MLNEELLKKIRYIELNVKKKVDNYLQGSYHTLFKGQGLEFQEVREYTESDDARLIDWNVTARTGKPFVKVFREERELTVMIAADVSGSTVYGKSSSIREVMATIAAAISFSAIKNSDKVGLLLFSDRIEEYIPPRRGRNHLLTVIRALLTVEPEGKKTDPEIPFRFLNKAMKRKTLIFFLTDMLFDNIPESLIVAASKHEITPVGVIDGSIFDPLVKGAVKTVDPETGESLMLDLGSAGDLKLEQFISEKENRFKRIGLRPLWIMNRENFMDDLVNEFKKLSSARKK